MSVKERLAAEDAAYTKRLEGLLDETKRELRNTRNRLFALEHVARQYKAAFDLLIADETAEKQS